MRLTDARNAKHWTRAQLAHRSGLAESRITEIERTPACADATERAVICAIYRLSLADLWPEVSSNE